MTIWAIGIGLSALCLLLAGCGYTLVGAPPATGAQTPVTLAVPAVINLTREPDLERRMTSALRRAVVQAPALKLAPEAQASHTLQGIASRFLASATSFDSSDRVVQFRVESRTRIRLTVRQSAQPLLDQEINAWTEYLVSPSGSVRENAAARAAALARVSRQFAEKCRALIEITLM
ncbi:LPS assembly lipoprotein LptE [Candidatus Entotheonella palauensis]|uniref:LPS-assembly lipoprotein LptE n=1 Tax=Candidatus Entotheonella gemina TaxID=1429439 RepID=W4M5C5_9BACT|nr:LPS assembly lipoprotein LptE [Candidatus Entotheonella palauensis]ETX05400.1 MAG: hypothetical protein ETSY2_23175 [Candidatus Entotheonella gemina]